MMTAPRRIQLSRAKGWRKPANTIVVQGHPMTYRITIELDTTKEQAETLSHIIADWAHGEDPNALSRLPDSLEEMSPAVSLEPHHPDDDQLRQAVQHLRRLGFDTAAAAVQTARRNLNADDPPNANLATERRLHARAAVNTHQARGGRIL